MEKTTPDLPDPPVLEDEIVDFVAGRLAPIDASRIAAAAQRDPHLAAEIATLTALRHELRAGNGAAHNGHEFGWARLSKAIDGEQQSARATTSAQRWRAIAAVAVIACAVQTGAFVIGQLTPTARYETAALDNPAPFAAQVTFAPTAREADLRAVLLAAKAQIIEGPSSLGVYHVAFDSEDARAAGLGAFAAADHIVTFAAAQ